MPTQRIRVFLAGLLALLLIAAGDSRGGATTQPAPASQPAAATWNGLPAGANVAVIKIDGVIYDYVYDSFQKRADRAVKGGASLIVVELDTPGGTVDSATKISRYIKALPVPTVAWIHDEAYSGGILVAAACNAIVMSPSSTTGDCAPIIPGMNLAPTERAKALSPVLAEFKDSAGRNGYDFALFHAMCELGVELYQIQNPSTSQVRIVNQGDYAVLVKGVTVDDARAAARSRAGVPPTGSTPPAPPPTPPVPAPGASPIPGLPLAPVIAPPTIPVEDLGGFMPSGDTTDDERGQWRLVKQVHDGKSLLTVREKIAADIGLSKNSAINTHASLQSFLKAAAVTEVEPAWAESAAYWLTTPWVRAILIVIFFIGVFIEFQTPGHFIGAGIAAVALVVLLIAPFLIGLAQLWHLGLFFLGLVLLIIEFITPTFGALGIVGVILMFAGLILSIVPTAGGPITYAPPMWRQLQASIIWALIAFVGSVVGFFALAKYFGKLPFAQHLILRGAIPGETADGPPPDADPDALAASGVYAQTAGAEAIGAGTITPGLTGHAVSQLRPSGRAEINGRVIDVVTDGQWIDTGDPVRVTHVAGNRIVVTRS